MDLGDKGEGEGALDRALDNLRAREQAHTRGGDGYYLSEDEHALVMFVRSDLRGGESRGGRALFRGARATADGALRGRRGDLSVGIGGSVKVALDEADAIGGELLLATSATVLCVLLAIFLFFRRERAIALLGAALAECVPRSVLGVSLVLSEIRPHADAQTTARTDEALGDFRAPAPTLDDLPEELASAYTERDGSRGRALSVTASHAHSLWDGRYLVRWTRGMRELRLSTGERPLLLGRGPVFADVLGAGLLLAQAK